MKVESWKWSDWADRRAKHMVPRLSIGKWMTYVYLISVLFMGGFSFEYVVVSVGRF